MSIKSDRHRAINSILSSQNIQNQEDLLFLLSSEGFSVTQGTLSRDMKELKVVRVYDSQEGYCYRMPKHNQPVAPTKSHSMLSSDNIISIEFASSKAVIKTRPGFASFVASIIDSSQAEQIMGTIAGDDTVLIILRDSFTKGSVLTTLAEMLPGIENKVINS